MYVYITPITARTLNIIQYSICTVIKRYNRLSVKEKNEAVHLSGIHKEYLSDNSFIKIVECEEQST